MQFPAFLEVLFGEFAQAGVLQIAFDWLFLIHGPIRSFVFNPTCEFQL